ncbi:tetratricopeptide repeat protein [Geoalkalibacter halelectricus]|uniref:Tetratricopeptide repeat protein n=1 Tax=Geoalkalibacter halelectricus TaxID=2847045 RepID=A0ABY5ZQH6_9BACT|nr:tetratricopeptide repeat protein [Geoalkalibacter halelectricus]MDO3378484.1 tetratricopeptide repeat protein [Geoalkalibacter halelectricus]UWZ80197.1 tetratricopeptide repeat protein [Geoalkalibacter halelectricus]
MVENKGLLGSSAKDKAGSGAPPLEQLRLQYQGHCGRWEEVLLDIHRRIRALLERHGYSPTIKYRVKRFENFYEKLNRAERGGSGSDPPAVSDLLGLRIICPFLEDIDGVERLITENFPIIEVERKGAQHSFREFGYDSVHLLMRLDGPARLHLSGARSVCEIQLRTTLQDAWAEVEHELVYKSTIALPKESVKRKLAALNAILTLSDLMFQEIRDFQKEIRKRDEQRRTKLGPALPMPGCLGLPEGAEEGSEDLGFPLLSVAGAAGGNLEKAMLAALDAHSRGELEAAINLYGRILEMKLDGKIRALVYNHRGMARFAVGDYRQALQDFSQVLRFDGANHRAYANRGLCYRLLGRLQQSLKDYEKAVEMAPAALDGFWGRAQTCYEMGLLTRALADCEKVLSLKDDFAPARQLAQAIRHSMF